MHLPRRPGKSTLAFLHERRPFTSFEEFVARMEEGLAGISREEALEKVFHYLNNRLREVHGVATRAVESEVLGSVREKPLADRSVLEVEIWVVGKDEWVDALPRHPSDGHPFHFPLTNLVDACGGPNHSTYTIMPETVWGHFAHVVKFMTWEDFGMNGQAVFDAIYDWSVEVGVNPEDHGISREEFLMGCKEGRNDD